MQALKMEDITKTFPGVVANDGITLSADKGQILAIVGENGAGKSTLMSILYGHYQPDEGSIYINGSKEDINSPTKAIALGIGMVFQHFMLVPTLTVYENIILGKEITSGIRIDEKKAIQECADLAEQYGMNIDVTAKVSALSLGIQQKVEILKTLYRKAEIIILDEPTSVLTPIETEELFVTLKNFAATGKTIIFISHKLQEVLALSDVTTVIRRGKVVGTVQTADTSQEQLAQMMVGRDVVLRVTKKDAEAAPKDQQPCVEVKDLKAPGISVAGSLKGISFDIKKGEILGIAGIEGNGQTELLEALTGLRKVSSGEVTLNGKVISGLKPKEIREQKVIHIPEDRHKRGLILQHEVMENLVLGIHTSSEFAGRFGVRKKDNIDKNADKQIEKYDIRGGGKKVRAINLSGGNQQKIVIAREFEQEHHFLIASQPTRGVDVGAIEFIHQKILESREVGKAVLLISADLNEVMSLSDRIAVLFEGQIVGIVDAKTTTETQIGLMMAGISNKEEEVNYA